MEAWKVHKFGGSSVADAVCMRRVASIIEADPARRKAVVLSACRGVTDALLDLVNLAERQDAELDRRVDELRARHVQLARDLLPEGACDEFVAGLEQDCRDITGILQTVRRVRAASTTMHDLIAGYGEIWSTQVFTRLLRARAAGSAEPRWLDARRVLLVEWGPLGPGVRWERSQANLRARAATRVRGDRGRHRIHRDRHPGSADNARVATAATSPRRSSVRCSTRERS